MSIQANQTALASDFVNTSTGAAEANKGVKLNLVGQLEPSLFKTRIVRVYGPGSATWTKPTSLAAVLMEVQGPGSGGGSATTAGTGFAEGGSGGGGGFGRGFTTAAVFTTSVILFVGSGGAVDADANADSNFGQFIYGKKGTKGGSVSTSTGGTAGTGGTVVGSSVDLAVDGEDGQKGYSTATNTGGFMRAYGGRSFWGGRGKNYGGGGNGEHATSGGSIDLATAGKDGRIILTEFYY